MIVAVENKTMHAKRRQDANVGTVVMGLVLDFALPAPKVARLIGVPER